jgi:hypothetical protein
VVVVRSGSQVTGQFTPSSAWLVLARDVSDSVHVAGQPTVAAAIVMDDERGLILASGLDTVPSGAVRDALRSATSQAGRPARILCPSDLARDVRAQLPAVGLTSELAIVDPSFEVEDVFDSLVGHLAGRQQPTEMPSPEEWSMLFRQTQVFAAIQPWLRVADSVLLRIELRMAGVDAQGIGVVLGNAGIAYGFALYPSDATPPRSMPTGNIAPPPPGTLILTLDPASALPAHLVAKARRYRWPATLPLSPVFFAIADEGAAADLSSPQVAHLTIALAAALDYDRAQPSSASTGEIILSGSRRGQYRLTADLPAERQTATSRPADLADGSPSIDAALNAFLVESRQRLGERTLRTYVSVLDLLRSCLNNYGYQLLSESEERQFQAAYAAGDEDAFCRIFGPDKIVENLNEFLGYFMIRKVAAGAYLLRASGTVTGKLVTWLAHNGYVARDVADEAARRAKISARDLPRAMRLGEILFDAAERAPSINVNRLADENYIEDELVITRVEPGQLWFDDGIGPVKVPRAATDLARPGWSVSLALASVRGHWRVVQVGNVYPC